MTDTLESLRAENGQLREYIAAAKEVAEARTAVALQADLDDLRARMTAVRDEVIKTCRIRSPTLPVPES